MKQVYFNELTLDNLPQQNLLLLKGFCKAAACFFEKTKGVDKRLVTTDSTIAELYKAISTGSCEDRNNLLSWFQRSFINQDNEDADLLDERDYMIRLSKDESVRCPSLGLAFRNCSVALGFCSSEFWSRSIPAYEVEEMSLADDGSLLTETLDVICITDERQVVAKNVLEWVDENNNEWEDKNQKVIIDDSELPACTIPIEEKVMKICDHHGREILMEFFPRLRRNKYVVSAHSVSAKHRAIKNKFILKKTSDGRIDMCLHWEKIRVCFQVQTTGRNMDQTERIAEILRVEFDCRNING